MTVPRTLANRYELRELLGTGGMGEVYLAQDLMIDRLVAIKFVAAGVDGRRFLREARAAGRLTHPNIVTIYDVGTDGDRPFLAMEYVQGETLDRIVQQRRAIPLTTRLQWLEQLCDGLSAAHKAGVVHLDIKPSNLMLATDGRLKIVDFGIATATDISVTLTSSVTGSLPYMAPEQLAGTPTDARTDIFAATAVAYELLSYERAFPGGPSTAARRLVDTSVPSLEKSVAGLGEGIDRIIRVGLSRNPDGRPQTAEQLGGLLARFRERLEGGSQTETILIEPVAPGPSGGGGLFGTVDTSVEHEAVGTSVTSHRPKVLAGIGAVAVVAALFWQFGSGADDPGPAPPVSSAPGVSSKPGPAGTQAPDGENRTVAADPGLTRRTDTGRAAGRGGPAAPPTSTESDAGSQTPATEPAATPQTTAAPGNAEPPANTAPPPAPVTPGPVAASPPPAEVKPAAPSTADDENAIRQVLREYARAYSDRSTAALKAIYPGLTGSELAALERAFLNSSEYQLTLSDIRVQVQGAQAKATCRAAKRIVPLTGEPRNPTGPGVFDLMRSSTGWVIIRAVVP
jgi:serine/threonine-protein kinase